MLLRPMELEMKSRRTEGQRKEWTERGCDHVRFMKRAIVLRAQPRCHDTPMVPDTYSYKNFTPSMGSRSPPECLP